MLGAGAVPARLMFVGEAPNKTDAYYGQPFAGDAGETLKELLALAGINPEEVYVTNCCKCWPWEYRKKEWETQMSLEGRQPDEQELRTCGKYLRHEIEVVKPKVIVALGGTALNALEGRVSKITNRMGIPALYRPGNAQDRIYLLPTLHPSYVKRNGGVKTPLGLTVVAQQVIEHLQRAVSMLDESQLYVEHHYLCVDSRARVDCRLRLRGFAAAGAVDPIAYAGR